MLSVMPSLSSGETARTPLAPAPKTPPRMVGTAVDERVSRLVASALVGGIGLGLAAAVVASAISIEPSPPALVVAAVGTVFGVVLAAAGLLLYRADFTPSHTLRVAGWALFGTVVLGLVLVPVVVAGTSIPLYAAATLLAVSAFAHALVGVRDVQRLRAGDLARQREQFEVLNRVVRRNLGHESQTLLFAAERLERDDVPDHDVADDVEAVARTLSAMNDRLGRSQELIRGEAHVETVDLRKLLVDLADRYREEYPEAGIELVLPESCRVRSGDQLRIAVAELLENALEHAGPAPDVTVDATNRPEGVLLEIRDNGPGIPEAERAVFEREGDVDQLEHGSGLGLWYVRWVLDAYGGDIAFEVDAEGTTVRLALPAA